MNVMGHESWQTRAERAEEALRRIAAANPHIGTGGANPLKVENERLRQQLAGAVSLLRELIEPQTEPCRYDHHGYCQAHWLHERPCPVERLRDFLGGQS